MATTTTPKKKASAKAAKTVQKAAPVAATEAVVYSMAGKEVSKVMLPTELFGASWKADLVHQVVTAMQANLRQNRAHTKDRSEVSGGGKKPWKQKGTGNARHGSTRSPIWRHGGITFGPRNERDYSEKINKRMRANALFSVLSRKMRDGEVLFVDELSFNAPKTAEAKKFLSALANGARADALAAKSKNGALIALSGYDLNSIKSFRNIGNVLTEEVRNLNPVDVLAHRYLIIERPQAAFKTLGARTKSKK